MRRDGKQARQRTCRESETDRQTDRQRYKCANGNEQQAGKRGTQKKIQGGGTEEGEKAIEIPKLERNGSIQGFVESEKKT
mmetsp:Transcript_16409/g.33372  ORF Transcript_16409/g.33372 Transcript_16409/m.33372 type:complete len:80 (+) Transcript_16409:1354-1593(+)